MARDHLAGGPQFRRDFLMGGHEWLRRSLGAAQQEKIRQPPVDRPEGEFLHAGDQLGDAPPQVVEDEAPEGRGLCKGAIEGRLGKHQDPDPGLGEGLGGIVVPGQDTAGGEDTRLAGQHPIQQRLAPAFTDDLHTNTPFQHQNIVGTGRAGKEDGLFRREFQALGTRQQGAGRRVTRGQGRKQLGPCVVRHVEISCVSDTSGRGEPDRPDDTIDWLMPVHRPPHGHHNPPSSFS